MKVKETIKNKYEECKEKISDMDDFTKGLNLGTMIGIGGILLNQYLTIKVANKATKESFVNGYMSGIGDVLNNKVNVMKLKITKN
nr:MAG TPA: hypothetical protein [Caudoviricetes sp.]